MYNFVNIKIKCGKNFTVCKKKVKSCMKFDENEELSKSSPIRKHKVSKRKLVRETGELPENSELGLVVAQIGNTVIVESGYDGKAEYIDCKVSGKIITPHSQSNLVAVGDKIQFLRSNSIAEDSGLVTGRIVAVEQRETYFSRKAAGRVNREHVIAANCDKLLILSSLTDPVYNRRFIDRVLLAAEFGDVQPAICVNKTDLFDDISVFEEDFEAYPKMGIEVFFVSALNQDGLNDIIKFVKDSTTLLFGPSGVGKSTLLNDLVGQEVQEVAEISDRTGKGQHTTSAVRMFKLSDGTRLIDSPGVREFALWNVNREELPLYFRDFVEFMHDCKFTPCTHMHEPGCAVISAVERGEIDAERYQSYINLVESTDEIAF